MNHLQLVNTMFEQILAGKMSQPGSGRLSIHSLPEDARRISLGSDLSRQSMNSNASCAASMKCESGAQPAAGVAAPSPFKTHPFAHILGGRR